MKNIIVTLTGPSGSGKSHLEAKMVERGFGKIISTTTRQPRPGEIDGHDYHFIDQGEFDRQSTAGMFAENVTFGDNKYGASVYEFTNHFDQDNPVVLVCEPTGASQIKLYADACGWNVFDVFITNDLLVLIERYLQRLTGDDVQNKAAYHARRISAISDERAWINRQQWSSIVSGYDETNDELVLNTICDQLWKFIV